MRRRTAIQALRAGTVDFVLKPFRSIQPPNGVANYLDRAALLNAEKAGIHDLDQMNRQGGGLPEESR